MKRIVVSVLLWSILAMVSYGQEMTNDQMVNKIQELERRVGILERLILAGSSQGTDAPKAQVPTDKVGWRKLRIGMKEDEVRIALGEPTSLSRFSADLYVWKYSTGISFGSVTFDRKGVSSWDEPN